LTSPLRLLIIKEKGGISKMTIFAALLGLIYPIIFITICILIVVAIIKGIQNSNKKTKLIEAQTELIKKMSEKEGN
jgi:hypothetical protein